MVERILAGDTFSKSALIRICICALLKKGKRTGSWEGVVRRDPGCVGGGFRSSWEEMRVGWGGGRYDHISLHACVKFSKVKSK